MGFSRKGTILSKEALERLSKPLTKEEEEQLDKEIEEMFSKEDNRTEEDIIHMFMTYGGSMDCPGYFNGKYKKYINNGDTYNE